MKKKLLSAVLVALVLLVAMLALGSCGGVELTAPSGIQYDGTTIKWNSVEGAEKYHVKINDLSEIATIGTAYSYQSNSQFTVTITAIAEDADEVSTTHTFIPLDRIESINVSENGELSWNSVNNAASYTLNINGTDTAVYDTKYSFNEAGTYTVKVKPATQSTDGSTSYYSVWSSEKTLTICQNVNADSIVYSPINAQITWDSVQGAAKYHLVVTGGGHEVDEIVTSTKYSFDAGMQSFTIRVQALGNGSTSFDSKDVAEKKLVYLEAPKNLRVVDGILYWDEVAGADGYQLKINNIVQHDIVNACEFSGFPVSTSVTVSILPVSNDTVYFSSWTADFSFTILPAPVLKWNNLALDGQENNNIYWDTVNGATGYAVKVTFNGVEIDSATLGEGESAYANSYLNVGEYVVTVKSLASNATTNISDSVYSAPIKITRLPAPTFATGNYITSDPANAAAGFTVSFIPVAGASNYKIWKDDTEYATIGGTLSQYTDANVLAPSVIQAQQYNYKIQSIGSGIRSEGAGVQRVILDSLSSASLSFVIDVLPAPESPNIEGYEYSYKEVSGAFGYTVSLSGRPNVNDDNTFNLEQLEPGVTNISVCSRGDGKAVLSSNYTPEISIHRLAAPTDIAISTDTGSDGQLLFTEVEHTSSYEVVIKGYAQPLPVNNMTNIKEHITTDGTTLHMVAVANYFNDLGTVYYMTSPASTTHMFTKLSSPTFGEKPFADGWFNWNAPDNIRTATFTPTYKVYNAQNILQGATYNGTAMSLSTLEPGTYSFRVVAVGNGSTFINSDLDDAVTIRITKLKTPTVTIENNSYTWNTVPNATNYAVYVDGNLAQTDYNQVGTTFTFTPKFDQLKEYTVEVIAIGDGGIDYIDSKPYVIKQQTTQLTTPEFSWSYSAEHYQKDGKITLSVTKESPYATGYYFSFGGSTFETTEKEYSFIPNTTGSIKLSVYARGGGFDADGMYYLDSQSTAKTINILNTPGNIDVNAYGEMTWYSVPNATQYEVVVTYAGTTYDKVIVNNASCDLLEILGVSKLPTTGALTVTIRALGDSSCVASESFTDDWSLGA